MTIGFACVSDFPGVGNLVRCTGFRSSRASPTSLGMSHGDSLAMLFYGKYEHCVMGDDIVGELNVRSNCGDSMIINADTNGSNKTKVNVSWLINVDGIAIPMPIV